MDEIKSQKELLEENESLKSEIIALQKSNFKLQEYAKLIEESEEQFRAFANQTTEGVTVADLEGNYVYVNPGFCKMSGYTEEELLGLTVFDMKSKEESRERFSESKKDKEGSVMLVELQKKDKTIYCTEIIGNVITVGDKKLVLGTIRDVTERKFSENKLKKSESGLKEAQKVANIGSWSLNLIKNELNWSNQIYNILGIKRTDYEPSYETMFKLIHPDDRELLDSVFKKSIEEKSDYFLEHRLILKDGSIKWVVERGHNEYDSNGTIIKSFGTVQDITEQKQASEKLLESENRNSTILKNLKTGVVIHIDNEIVYVNDAIVDMLGYTNKPSVIGRDIFDFVHPKDHNLVLNAVKESIKDSNITSNIEEMSVEVRFLNAEGNIVLVKNIGISINYYGRKARMVMIDNITNQKLAEENLQRSEKRYRSIFESTPIALWEEDFSEVKVLLDALKKKGVKHFKKYFDEHPEFVQKCADATIIIDINDEAVLLHGAASKDKLLNNLTDFFLPESFEAFKTQLIALVEGENRCELDTVVKTKNGNKKHVHLRFVVAPGYETDFKKVYISIQDISNLKKTQLNLIEHKNKLNEVLNIAHLGSFIFDDSTNVFKSSLIADEILGINELYKRDVEGWANLIHPEDFEKVYQFVNNIDIESGTIELRVIRPVDKKIIWVFANIKKEHDKSGARSKITGTFRDSTESKLIMKSLTESKNLLIETQQIAKIGSFSLDFTTGLWKSSLELDMIFGIKTKTKKNLTTWLNMIHPDDKEMMSEYLETNIIHNHEFFNKEYRIVNNKSKKIIWVHGIGGLEFDDKGNLLSMKGTIQDITETKNIREAFNKKNELLINLSAQIPGAIYQFLLRSDGSSCFPYASAGIKDIYGLTPEQLTESAEDAFTVIHPDDLERVGESIQESADNESLWCDEYRIVLPDNKEPFWVEGYATPEKLDDGSTLWHGILTNIDQRKKAEERLQLYSKLFTESTNEIYLFDIETYKFIEINNAAYETLGYSEEEILKMSPIDIKPEIDLIAFEKLIKPLKENRKKKIEFQHIHQRKDGTLYNADINLEIIKFGNKKYFSAFVLDITERVKAEKKIKFLSEITQQSKTAVLTTNLDFEITWVNESFTKLYGYTLEEIMGKSPIILNAEFLAEEIQHEIYDAVSAGGKYKSKILNKKKNSDVFPCELEIFPILDKEGSVFAYSGHIVDFTGREKIEYELKESETRFKALHNASFGGLAIHSKGVIIDCNQGLTEMSGYSTDELIGMDGLLLIEESFREYVMDKIVAGYEKPYEVVGVRKNKELFPLRVEGKEIPYKGKQVRSVEFRDITNQKKVEGELKASEKKFRSTVELAPNPVMIHDEDGKVMRLSKGWTMYSGYTIEDIPTINDWTKKAYGKENEYAEDYIYDLFMINKTKNNGEWNVKAKSGEMRVWEFYTTPLGKDYKGKRILSSIAFDITDRNKEKVELEAYRESLEQLVKERTKELESKNNELDRAMKVFVGREMKIRELNKKINQLKEK